MLKITEYGEKIQENFLEQCKKDGTYQRVFGCFEDGTCLLEESIRGVKDYAAWYLITYDTNALNIVDEWRDGCEDDICWCTNWSDLDNAFFITYEELITELNKSLIEQKEDISVQLTLTGEEIEQLAKVTGCDIENKEDLTQAIRMAIEKYVETCSGN